MKRRFVSLLLAACMVSSLLPSTAWATGEGTDPGTSTGGEASGAIAAHAGCKAEGAVAWPAADPAAPEETQEESGEPAAPETEEGTYPAQEETPETDPAQEEEPAQTEESTPAEPASAQPQGKTRQAEVDSAVKVKSFADLAAAVGNDNVTDIVLTTDKADGGDTWTWNSTLNISRTIHISVEDGKTITLKRAVNDKELFNVAAGGTLILGDGTISTKEEGALQKGNYEVTKSGGELIIDGGAVWGTPKNGDNNSAFFINKNGERVQQYNTGIAATASLINCPSGTLDIWGGVTLKNNHKSTGKGSAIFMENKSDSTQTTLNLYGGVVEWCATTGCNEDGTGAIYCGNPIEWTKYSVGSQYGYINLYAGGVQYNANYSNISGDKAGDGTGIALDAATLKRKMIRRQQTAAALVDV